MKTVINSGTATVGEDLVLTLQFEGGLPDPAPDFGKIDGLEVFFGGQSSMTSFVNGRVSHTASYNYRVTPTHEGDLVIPPVELNVEGQKLKTESVSIKVSKPRETVPGDFAFGEIRLSRKFGYVGESMDLEVVYYIEAAARWEVREAPDVAGEGFSGGKFSYDDQQIVTMAGKRYRRGLFRTILTPNRAGKITVGSATLRTAYTKESGVRYNYFTQLSLVPLTIVAPAIELEVKPLPIDGRPKDFSGGIGTFTFSAQGKPDRVTIGEPLAMNLKVTGRGNFDRLGAPGLLETDGWKDYPAKDQFDAADPRGVTGTKHFQVVVTPTRKHEAMPIFRFSYFDPDKEKYVSLTSQAQPLVVVGEVPAAPAVPQTPAPAAPPPAAPAPDIVGIRPLPGFWGHLWMPAPALWFGIILAPAPVLAALLFWRARRSDPVAARRAGLQRERAALLSRLRGASDRGELFDTAARVMQIDLALATHRSPGEVDEAAVLARTSHAAVQRVFAARAELVYAGGESVTASATDRDEAQEAIDQLARTLR